MVVFFFLIKILLTLVTVLFLITKNDLVVFPFFLFIAVDILDGRILGEKYRIYDTIGDRIFVYANFLTFLFLHSLYPEIIYISAFFARDLIMLQTIRACGKTQINSDFFDRAIIFVTALVFILRVLDFLSPRNIFYEPGIFFLALMILLFGARKSLKVRNGQKERKTKMGELSTLPVDN